MGKGMRILIAGGAHCPLYVRLLIVLGGASSSQEPILSLGGPCLPGPLGPQASNFHLGPGGRSVVLGPFLSLRRVRYGPGLLEGLNRLLEGGQPEGEFDRPVWEDTHGQEIIVGDRPTEAVADQEKLFSVGSPLMGKHVGCLPPTSGSHPAALGARAGTQSCSGVAFQPPAITQGTSPRPATWQNISFQRAFGFFQRSGVPRGQP